MFQADLYCADYNSLSHSTRFGLMVHHSVELSSETILILKTTCITSFIVSIFSSYAAFVGNKLSNKCEERKKNEKMVTALVWLSGAMVGFGLSLLLLFGCLLVYVSSYGSLRYDYLQYEELSYKVSQNLVI